MVATLLSTAIACASETQGTASACPDITGNYSVTAARVSGSCDTAVDPKDAVSVGMTKNGDGSYSVVLPGVEGGCPGELDPKTCKFTSACELKDKAGEVIGTASLDYTFSASGYSGSSVNGVRPPVVTTACEVTYRETGTKL